MTASTGYHLFSPLSAKMYNRLLTIDLMGIGFMIFGLTLCAVYIGFHNWPFERNCIMTTMSVLLVLNLGIQMTPCYIDPKYECYRLVFYSFTLFICLCLALSGRFYFGTGLEVEEYYG
jgi:predicted membrane channel-forming protein YqfA (hemolysin III family)